MTSRERVLTAFNHRESDRIPADLSGHRSSGIAAVAYKRLRQHLGFPSRPLRVYDIVQQLAIVDDDVLDLFSIDTIELGRAYLHEEKDWKEWLLPDGTPCLIPRYIAVERQGEDWIILSESRQELGRQKKGCLYFEQSYFPLLERGIANEPFDDLEHILPLTLWTSAVVPGAHVKWNEAGMDELARGARALRHSTDRAIIGLFGGNMFEVPQMLYRMDNYLLSLSRNPDAVLRLSEKLCALYLEQMEMWLPAVGPYIDIILFGDDLGGQQGPLISPEMYRRYYKPFHKRLWGHAKELAPVKVMLHSCGSIGALLPDMIEAGLDAVNPIQISSRGMKAMELKKEFGQNITFWGGGCDTQKILPHGSPKKIRDHVREQVDIWRHEGGFVFQQVHNILADVPAENIVAMFESLTDNC